MTQRAPLSDLERADLVAYLDGELNGPAARALEAKLQLNPQVRAEAEGFRQTYLLLDYLPRPQPSPTFTSRTLERLSALPAPPARRFPLLRLHWRHTLGWAAAILVAAVAGFGGGSFLARRTPGPELTRDIIEQALQRDGSVIENQRWYEHVDNIEFLKALADLNDTELFGADPPGIVVGGPDPRPPVALLLHVDWLPAQHLRHLLGIVARLRAVDPTALREANATFRLDTTAIGFDPDDVFWPLYGNDDPSAPLILGLVRKARAEADPSKRAELYKQVSKIARTDALRVPLLFADRPTAASGRLVAPMGTEYFGTVWLRR